MTKLGVIADSHRNKRRLALALEEMKDCRYILCLGDHDSDMEDAEGVGDRLRAVCGNCDPFSSSPCVQYLQVENVRLMMTHGDAYGVKYSLTRLFLKAKSENVRVALYGHTHERRADEQDGVLLLNPGALKDGKYLILEIDGDKIDPVFKEV